MHFKNQEASSEMFPLENGEGERHLSTSAAAASKTEKGGPPGCPFRAHLPGMSGRPVPRPPRTGPATSPRPLLAAPPAAGYAPPSRPRNSGAADRTGGPLPALRDPARALP